MIGRLLIISITNEMPIRQPARTNAKGFVLYFLTVKITVTGKKAKAYNNTNAASAAEKLEIVLELKPIVLGTNPSGLTLGITIM